MSSQEQEILHRMAAMALYKMGEPICSSLDDEDYAAFIHRLNPAYNTNFLVLDCSRGVS